MPHSPLSRHAPLTTRPPPPHPPPSFSLSIDSASGFPVSFPLILSLSQKKIWSLEDEQSRKKGRNLASVRDPLCWEQIWIWMYHFCVPDPGVTLPAAVVAQNSVSLKQRAELPLPPSPDRSPAPGSSHGGHPPSQPPSTKYRHPKGFSKGRHPRTGLPHTFRSPSAGPLPAHPVLSQS